VVIRESAATGSTLTESLPTGASVIGGVTGSGNFNVVGPGAVAAAVSGNPVRVGASDGTNTRNILADTSGRLLVSGAATSGAAAVGSPVLVGGSDGTNARTLATDTSGRQVCVGPGTAGTPIGGVLTIQGVTGATAVTVDGSGVTQPVSVVSLPLPTGAATESTLTGVLTSTNFQARVNTLGQKAMAASTPVVLASDQTAIPVTDNGSSLTVDGTVTADIGTTGGLALDATLTGGTQKAIVRAGAKGITTAADVTSTAEGSDHQALDIQVYHGGTAVNPTDIRALTLSDVVTSAQGTAAAIAGAWPVKVTDGTNSMPTGDSVSRALFQKVTDGTNTAAVKAASTAPLATDPALVVSISPNSTLTATNPSIGSNNAASPTSSTLIGGTDGTNLQAARVFDADSGAGNQYVIGTILRKSASGGSVEAGTSSDPIRVDPTGTTTQPVSVTSLPLPTGAATETTLSAISAKTPVLGQTNMAGSSPVTIADNQTAIPVTDNGTTLSIDDGGSSITVDATSWPLPTGAATETTLTGVLTTSAFQARVNTLGQKAMANSTPVVLSSDQTVIPVSDNGSSLTVDGTVTANQGTSAALSGRWPVIVTDGTNTMPAGDTAGRGVFHRITDGTNNAAVKAASTAAVAADPALVVAISPNNTVSVSAVSLPLPTGSATSANQTTLGSQTTKINDGTNTATVKAASTAAVASDTAIVVAISPNNPIVASNSSVSATGSAPPAQATSVGGSVTTAAPSYTTGQLSSLSLTTAGGLRVDGSGSTQPVSASSLPLPTGAATETTLSSINTKTLAAGQAAMAASSPVVIASNQTAIPITDNGGSLTVDGTVTANQGAAAALSGFWPTRHTDGTNTMPTGDVAARGIFHRITDGTNTAAVKAASTAATAADPALVVAISPNNTVPVSAVSLPLPSGAATETTLGTRLADSTFTARINTLGQKNMASSTPVVISSDQSEVASKNAASSQVDGHSVSIGATSDADTANTVIGRLKQIITRLAGGLPASLIGGRLDTNIGAWLGSTSPTVGQKTGASSIPFVAASDQWPDALARSIFVRRTDGTNVAPTGDVVARSIFHQISDGATGPVSVKPASTAPVAADNALVVVLSPNQAAIPVTTAPVTSTPGIAFGDPTRASTALAEVRRTAYTEQTANFTGSIASSNANDSSAGTGARQVRISWMNATGTTIGTEDVTLNGTTAVNLVTSTKCFIEKMEVITVGSTGSNVGIITLFTGAAGGGTAVGTIAATNNQTFWAHHYVRSGLTCSVTGTLIGSSSTVAGNGSVFTLRSRVLPVANQPEKQIGDFLTLYGQSSQTSRNYGSYIKVPGPARILMYVTPVSGTSNVYRGSFDYYDS
jgi:hypothetical protein